MTKNGEKYQLVISLNNSVFLEEKEVEKFTDISEEDLSDKILQVLNNDVYDIVYFLTSCDLCDLEYLVSDENGEIIASITFSSTELDNIYYSGDINLIGGSPLIIKN